MPLILVTAALAGRFTRNGTDPSNISGPCDLRHSAGICRGTHAEAGGIGRARARVKVTAGAIFVVVVVWVSGSAAERHYWFASLAVLAMLGSACGFWPPSYSPPTTARRKSAQPQNRGLLGFTLNRRLSPHSCPALVVPNSGRRKWFHTCSSGNRSHDFRAQPFGQFKR